jgi:lauroyl/myristoyl acyltransferase
MSRISLILEEIIRIVSMQIILVPASYVLPRKIALGIAKLLALFLLVLPQPGHYTYYQVRSVFGKGRVSSLLLSWDRLALAFRDFVVINRLANKRESPFTWRIVEQNTDGINQLRRTGETYIVVIAHFSQVARMSLVSPKVTYNFPFGIGLAPREGRNLFDLRIRIVWGALLRAGRCWDRDAEMGLVGDDLHAATILYKRLRESGNVVFIALDAPWNRARIGTYERPFAGHRNRGFSTGAVQLARLAGCAIIACVPYIEDDGSIVLEWGDPMRIDSNDSSGEVKAMNRLLDTLEIGIGKRPTQYQLDIGADRRWNSENVRWEDSEE